ncbi:MAG: ribosomal-protein-alanine N-acetyltransferase [Ruminococcaceae bacterium]|nr:ribosomal-protein-alanine N-acetyltransferase [Oscillospiraceae bacterium]
MQIVPMAQRHIDALALLERACFSTPWSAESLREELANPHAVFRVAVDGSGTVLGYGGMHHLVDEGFITNVAVTPAARRTGVAKAILADLAAYGAEHSLYRITLEVRVSNTPAITLYEGAGYVRDGVRPGFYSHPTEDAAIYSLYF